MAIWLIARGVSKNLPRHLIYVVDRRTVVDQATDIAMRLVMRPITKWTHDYFDGRPPTISTLRGQVADNREWSRDLSRPAIIIGTVDLIGSALLFSGYRSSYRRRPLEAGLLGQDSLLVLDEDYEVAARSRPAIANSHGWKICCAVPLRWPAPTRMRMTQPTGIEVKHEQLGRGFTAESYNADSRTE